jgi:hypothetical protein
MAYREGIWVIFIGPQLLDRNNGIFVDTSVDIRIPTMTRTTDKSNSRSVYGRRKAFACGSELDEEIEHLPSQRVGSGSDVEPLHFDQRFAKTKEEENIHPV